MPKGPKGKSYAYTPAGMKKWKAAVDKAKKSGGSGRSATARANASKRRTRTT